MDGAIIPEIISLTLAQPGIAVLVLGALGYFGYRFHAQQSSYHNTIMGNHLKHVDDRLDKIESKLDQLHGWILELFSKHKDHDEK